MSQHKNSVHISWIVLACIHCKDRMTCFLCDREHNIDLYKYISQFLLLLLPHASTNSNCMPFPMGTTHAACVVCLSSWHQRGFVFATWWLTTALWVLVCNMFSSWLAPSLTNGADGTLWRATLDWSRLCSDDKLLSSQSIRFLYFFPNSRPRLSLKLV